MSEIEQSFTPIAPNPFVTGAPIRDSNMFFGREDDLEHVRQRLIAEEEGMVLMLVGARRSGKTSIMFQILNGKLGEDFLPVFIDMQLMAGIVGDREFLGRTATIILEAIEDKRLVADYYDFSEGNPILTFDSLLEDLQQTFPGRRLIFLLDEAEILQSKVDKGELGSAILSYMASILESRQVSFCFTGSVGLNETESEEWRRLTGKGDSREISFLSPGDTRRLIQLPVEGRMHYTEGAVDAIYKLTYGHPYYTQLICSYAVDHLNHAGKNELTHEDLEEVVRVLIDNPPPQLVYQWDDLALTERLALSIAGEQCTSDDTKISAEQLHQSIRDNKYPAEMRTDTLRIALESLARSKWLERDTEGTYRFRIDLFRQWVRHTRSIWSLVDETDVKPPRKKRWPLIAAVAVALIIITATVWNGYQAREQERQQEAVALAVPSEGQVWVDAEPRDVSLELWVDGKRITRSLPTMFSFSLGEHTVELRHKLYRTYSHTLHITASTQDTLFPTLERLTGTLNMRAIPPNTRVQLTGVGQDTALSTPIKNLRLPTGEYQLSAVAKGYVEQRQSVAIHHGKDTALNLNLQANVGDVYVRSNPANAQLDLNGQTHSQRTPLLLRNLPVGQQTLRLILKDHLPQKRTLRVRLGQTDTLDIDLAIRPVHIALDTQPSGAQVLLNNQPWHTTPMDDQLPPGTYDLRVVYDGYRPETVELNLKPGEDFVHHYDLVQYKGVIRIHDYFGDVDIISALNNRLVQSVQKPRDVTLPVGRYLLRGGHKGALVEVRKDERTIVKLAHQGLVRMQTYVGIVKILDATNSHILSQVQSPTDINLPIGEYILHSESQQTAITVQQNQTHIVRFE